MNNNELLGELSRRLECSEKDAAGMVASFFELVTEELQEGKDVELGNLGRLRVKKQMEKITVNASTGQRFLVPPELDVVFEPDCAWKEKLKNGLSDE